MVIHPESGLANTRILVTGGCGFIGSHLVEALVARGAHVSVADNLSQGTKENLHWVKDAVSIVELDIRDMVAVRRLVGEHQPQIIFHLAANASVPGSVGDPWYDFSTNTLGTFVMLDALREQGVCEKFILASSGAVYGQPERFPITENDALAPISPYGASKLAAEVQTQMFGHVYGMPVCIARLFNAYGPRMPRFVVLDFLKKLHDNPSRLEILGSGQQVRDFTFVSDTVQGLIILATEGRNGDTYNVSSGVSVSVRELARTLIQALGLSSGTELTYTGESWIGDVQRWEVNIQKIQALGYRPAVSLTVGLQQTGAWFETL